jgi:hypothetical protein
MLTHRAQDNARAAQRRRRCNPGSTTALPMSELADADARTDLLNRLKRAEGPLRGVQRMIEEGQPCLDIAGQMAAVRKALDSTCVRLTVRFM